MSGAYYKPCSRDIKPGQRFGANPGWGPNPPGGHNGHDELTPIGTPVRAAGDGVVVFAGEFDSTYADNFGWNLNFGGKMVVLNLDGPEGPYVEYGHNSELRVKTGDRVTGGQIIALSGDSDGGTGVITGPHLHVGVLPPNFNLNTSTYGRVNPDLYLTRYWEDGISLAPQSAELANTSTPKEGFLMALTDKQQDDIYWILCAAEGRQFLANLVGAGAANHTLNTPIQRGGEAAGIGDGKTSLGAMVAWNDSHVVSIIASVAASSAASGASVGQIKEAVQQALKENVIKVDVSVEGAK